LLARIPRRLTALAILALALAGRPALAAPQADCIETTRRPVAAGGTNGLVAVAAADLDGDGDVDLLSVSSNDDTLAWYENDGGSPPAFTPRVISTNADGASAVAAGDLNLDGRIDVVAAWANDDTIAWYENDGETPPRFIERVIFQQADNASALHLADIDADGDLDIVSASFNDDTIEWHRNLCQLPATEAAGPCVGTPGFDLQPITTATTGVNGPVSVFAAEFNFDPAPEAVNYLDVLSASRLDDTIAWYEQGFTADDPDDPDDVPTRIFTRHVIANSADAASSAVAADLDGDGDADVASASSADDEIAWYENSGGTAPSFAKYLISTQADGAAAVFAADLDGDTDVDLLSASANDAKLVWYENVGGAPPTFTARTIATGVAGARAVVAAPIAPGAPIDVVLGSSLPGPIAASDRIGLYAGTGGVPAGFAAEQFVSVSALAAEVILTADVDGDGDGDVLAGSTVDSSILWFERLPGPAFVRRVVATNVSRPTALAFADVNGDGKKDVLSASSGDHKIAWHGNDGATPPAFTEHAIALDAEGASSVDAADVDDDGDLDVLAASFDDDTVAWHENGGGIAPTFAKHVITSAADGARSVVGEDLDGDGDLDVLVASAGDDTLAWFEQSLTADVPPARVFTERTLSTAALGARWIGVGDLDGDTDLDVVAASADDDTIAWFEQSLTTDVPPVPKFTRQIITITANFPREARIADLDGDTDLDVYAVSSGDDNVTWYENLRLDGTAPPAAVSFAGHFASTNSAGARSVGATDIDLDGKLDLVVAFQFGIDWHRGNGEELCGTFDADGDGRIDGTEVIRLGAAFGDFCADPGDPGAEWWVATDVNGDCLVDGEDLSVLTRTGVWGRDADPASGNACSFLCQ